VHREVDSDFDYGIGFRSRDRREPDFFEFRHLQDFNRIKLTGGFGYLGGARKRIYFSEPPNPPKTKYSSSHKNAYVYALVNYPESVTITLGTSADFYRGIAVERNQINPKIGLSWTPFPGTNVRGAVFRTLKRSLISSQTIEPTNVAGFSQFFDDDNATDSWRYGLRWIKNGSDHKRAASIPKEI
jgi:hypothetical protein